MLLQYPKHCILLFSITPPVFPNFLELSPLMDLASILPRGSMGFRKTLRTSNNYDITILPCIITITIIILMTITSRTARVMLLQYPKPCILLFSITLPVFPNFLELSPLMDLAEKHYRMP